MAGGIRIAVVAGEASGDLLGSHLIRALQARCPSIHFYGIAGPKMMAAGATSLVPMEKLSVSGYAEVLRHLPELLRIRRRLRDQLLADPPDLFIGIDAPDFNFDLEMALKAKGIPTLHFVSPSIWAWRGERIHKIARAVSHMLVVFPFEEEIYRKAGIPVTYVGHPLADSLPAEPDRSAARAQLDIPAAVPVLAMLPGSRVNELRQHARLFVETAEVLHQSIPDMQFLVPVVSQQTWQLFLDAWQSVNPQLPIRIVIGHAHSVMTAADLVLVASGTATLEAALLKRPMVITYRVARTTAWLMRRRAYLPWVGLPNILARRDLVPEILQEAATPQALATAVLALYHDPQRQGEMVAEFTHQYDNLRCGTADRIAEAVMPFLGGRCH